MKNKPKESVPHFPKIKTKTISFKIEPVTHGKNKLKQNWTPELSPIIFDGNKHYEK